jgi:COP9 signalosome complex subunit 6
MSSVIASLTTRLNAIRTLESRIRLIKSYLSSQRSSRLDKGESETKDPGGPSLSYPILRNISSLISHLSLLNPQDQESFAVESLEQANDVTLISLLGILGKSVQGMRELGKKLAIVETGKHSNTSRKSQLALHGRLEEGYLTSRDGIPAGKFVS